MNKPPSLHEVLQSFASTIGIAIHDAGEKADRTLEGFGKGSVAGAAEPLGHGLLERGKVEEARALLREQLDEIEDQARRRIEALARQFEG